VSARAAERPANRATTRHAQAIYPFMASGGLGGQGIFIGRDSSGGAFVYDGWVLYQRDHLKDANLIIFGRLGQGKSALIKTLIWRNLLFGRRAFVLDIKREYGPLCDLLGVNPIRLEAGGGVRLNPLAARPEEHAQLQLLRAIAQGTLNASLTQEEAGALREALRVVRERGAHEPTIPEIAAALFEPTCEMAERLRSTPSAVAGDVRRVALALQDLCEGPLRGMFDGPTTPGLDLGGRLVVIDLHAVRDTGAVGILMACASAWLSALLERMADRPGADRLINVSDESWKIVQHTGLGEWFQENFKLARRYGVMNVVALHKVSDLQAAGDSGSRASRIAEGLISEASTRVIYQQDAGQIPATCQLLGLTEAEAEVLTQLGPGQALWQVGRRSFVVQHYRSRIEARMTSTDEGMLATRTTPR
jgi:type IV secretory pathway VirB4 component